MKRKINILIIILVIIVLLSITMGHYPIGLKELFGILFSRLFNITPFWSNTQEILLINYRLPRIIIAILVGACLSVAGSTYQGIFQNPMASPDILGSSAGASFGACLAIILGLSSIFISLFAFLFSLLTVMLATFVGNKTKGKRYLGLILSGIMIGSLATSGTSFIKLVADPNDQLPSITYWLMGSLNDASKEKIYIAIFPMLLGFLPLFLLRWRINLLTLDEEEAETMGVNTKRLRWIMILCSTLITASSIAISGTIGWIGLVIPHFARKIVGNDYRYLLPASALSGSIFLLLVDNISRNLFEYEMPIGILTALIGVPVFLYFVVKGEQ